jgi:hypothetical protein
MKKVDKNDPIYKSIRLAIKNVAARIRIDEKYFQDLEVGLCKPTPYDHQIQCAIKVLAETLAVGPRQSVTVELEKPATWWDHFKCDVIAKWPGFLRRRFTPAEVFVDKHQIVCDVSAFYPMAPKIAPAYAEHVMVHNQLKTLSVDHGKAFVKWYLDGEEISSVDTTDAMKGDKC